MQGRESTPPVASAQPFEANQLLIQFAVDFPETEAQAAIVAHGGQIIRQVKSLQIYHVLLPTGSRVMDELERYRQMQGVILAEINHRRSVRNFDPRE
jgi:hypothetical protein